MLLLTFVLIATERVTNINKAAIAVFAGTVSWVLYISFGADFISMFHQDEYNVFLLQQNLADGQTKNFIWKEIFLPCVGRTSEVVLFLLATMTIVEILHNNGCFDFLTVWLRTRNSRVLLWKLTACAFFMSANLDNISTTVMMLTVVNSIIPRSRDRIVYGAAVVIAVIFGGALTVIGDPTTLVLWNMGAISATHYSALMLIPCMIAWVVPTFFIGRKLNETIQLDRPVLPYRGDDTKLNIWQRIVMLFVGIGGLWFIPTFHNITQLSPFLGAFCVLSILWIVNEVFNRKLMVVGRRISRSIPQQLQYSIIQLMLYVMGVMLGVGVIAEVGAFSELNEILSSLQVPASVLAVVGGLVSIVVDNFATAMTMISVYDVVEMKSAMSPFEAQFVQNGEYWVLLSYMTALGSSVLVVGSAAGVVYMKTQHVGISWYFRHVGIKVLLSGIIGFAVLVLEFFI